MGIERLFTRDVTVLEATVVADNWGNDRRDWTAPTERATKGWLARTDETELVDARDARTSDRILFLAAEDPITALSRVRIEGTTFEVNGPPNRAHTPRGEHHVEADLRVVEG